MPEETSCNTAILFALSIILAGTLVARPWTNGAVMPDNELLVGFGIWALVVGSPGATPSLLNVCGELHGQAWGGALSAGLVLFLAPIMLKHDGLAGAVLAMIISWILGTMFVLASVVKVKKLLQSLRRKNPSP